MKKLFTPSEIYSRRGCYEKEKVARLSFIKQESISIFDILNSEISIQDKRWFVFNSCDLELKQRIELALRLAKVVLPIYEKKYPNDKRVRGCLEAIYLFNKGDINREQLLEKRAAAADAAADAAAYAYAAAAADAAAYAAAAAAADAADAAADYKEQLKNVLIDFINEQPE